MSPIKITAWEPPYTCPIIKVFIPETTHDVIIMRENIASVESRYHSMTETNYVIITTTNNKTFKVKGHIDDFARDTWPVAFMMLP